MSADPDGVRRDADLSALVQRLGARAAGSWVVRGDRLVLIGFAAGLGLPGDVADRFRLATGSVTLDQSAFGIVGAATSGLPRISSVADLPAGPGSGDWLRAFGATRSVAVPVLGRGGPVLGVISVALLGDSPVNDEVIAALRAYAEAHPSSG